jgi:hypothetical protein
LAKHTKTFSFGIPQQEIADSLPRVRLYTMDDMRRILDEAGVIEPTKVS